MVYLMKKTIEPDFTTTIFKFENLPEERRLIKVRNHNFLNENHKRSAEVICNLKVRSSYT